LGVLMANNTLVRAATLNRIGDALDNIECVRLRDLLPATTLLISTVNSVYRVLITEGPDVYVQGGSFFPDATLASIDGASIGGSCLRVDCICIGLLVEIRSGGRTITTSPVRAIVTQQASSPVAH
jgi:hypothetical protein